MQGPAEAIWGKDWKSKFYPAALEQIRLGNPPGDENYYALPVLTQTINLWYTIPVLQDVGVSPPRTYVDLVKAANKLKQKGYSPLVLAAGEGWVRRDVFVMIMHNLAPGIIGKAEAGEASFTDPIFVEGLKWWKRLFDDGIAEPAALKMTYAEATNMIHQGKAGMFVVGSWWQQEASKKNAPPLAIGMKGYQPMKFPDLGNGQPEDLLGGIDVMVGVSKFAKDRVAACKVATDWVSGAGAQAYINTFADLPAWKGLAPQKFVSDNQKDVWDLLVKKWLPGVKEKRQMSSVHVAQELEAVLSDVASGIATPEDGATRIQKAIEESRQQL
jgi:raffinose/stachyose/melibiose transport system substrate-binding protein